MVTPQSVLIVDRVGDTCEVLRAVLERRGLHIYQASREEDGLQLAQRHAPDLIVYDLDREEPAESVLRPSLCEHASERQTPILVLGSAARTPGPRGERFIAKPYHYGPLIRRIEELLADA